MSHVPLSSDSSQLRVIPKGCDRCGGDLFFQSDRYGDYFGCLQCGAEVEARSLAPKARSHRRGKPPRRTARLVRGASGSV
jgi:hypothetical protein